ncbi:hypothetical protein EYF80_003720 [Liparis tanakae]|uniref:Uncharacterized protein n=1 Tax=Liparis tanakae TaxID=230148 RepID=A0A4Z2J6R1_9TELE|nr:hypothetical protein EYF80_003720 [Liparis tanakae]
MALMKPTSFWLEFTLTPQCHWGNQPGGRRALRERERERETIAAVSVVLYIFFLRQRCCLILIRHLQPGSEEAPRALDDFKAPLVPLAESGDGNVFTWEVAECKLDHFSCGLEDRQAATIRAPSSKPFDVRERSSPSRADARHALPLAMAIRSDTVLTGTLRVTLTWMKSVPGDRLEPSAFNK